LTLGEPTPELARELILEAIESAGPPALVWGYSQGARAAYDLALNAPDAVAALILESGAPGIEDPLARAERRSRDFALSQRIAGGTIEQFVETWEKIPALGEQAPAVIEKQRAARLSQDPAALAAALRGIGQAAYEPMWDRLGEIKVPVLLMTGENDPIYAAVAERVAELLPDAQRVMIPDAAHGAHISNPDGAVAAVAGFIANLS
jgi:2-succinyl-6-hydroxy-2,4-cyclohexadiene-1-carboxylate synthase